MTPERAYHLVMKKFTLLNCCMYPDKRVVCLVRRDSLDQPESYSIVNPVRKIYERASYIVRGHLVNPNGERIDDDA